jgi:hypothetical protein
VEVALLLYHLVTDELIITNCCVDLILGFQLVFLSVSGEKKPE